MAGVYSQRNSPHLSLCATYWVAMPARNPLILFIKIHNCLAFSALTLLAGRQEEHSACKNEWWDARVVICPERPEFGAKFRREVPLFLKVHRHTYNRNHSYGIGLTSIQGCPQDFFQGRANNRELLLSFTVLAWLQLICYVWYFDILYNLRQQLLVKCKQNNKLCHESETCRHLSCELWLLANTFKLKSAPGTGPSQLRRLRFLLKVFWWATIATVAADAAAASSVSSSSDILLKLQ